MNGLGLPTGQPSVRELREQLAMAEALEPIQQENLAAKQAYRDALTSGDGEAIAAAKERKRAAANLINETRTWLRRERMLTKLASELARLAEDLPKSHWQPTPAWTEDDHKALREARERLAWLQVEVPRLEAEAAPLRDLFAAAGPPVVVEDAGVTAVDLPAATVKGRAMKGGK